MTGDEEVNLVRESERGARARRILEDDLVKEAFSTVEDWIVNSWKESPIRDTEGQAGLRMMYQCLTRVRKHLEEVMATGKLANMQIEQERTIKSRMASAVRAFRS